MHHEEHEGVTKSRKIEKNDELEKMESISFVQWLLL
jgi:hypothetical protein